MTSGRSAGPRSFRRRCVRSTRRAYAARLCAGRGPGSADSDLGRTALGVLHPLRDAHRLLDEGLDDLGLRDGLDDLALDEDLSLAVAGGDPEVGLAGLARAVDDAAHDGDTQRHLEPVETGRDLVGELVDVDLRAPARRARDDLEAARAQVERLQDLHADLDLRHR